MSRATRSAGQADPPRCACRAADPPHSGSRVAGCRIVLPRIALPRIALPRIALPRIAVPRVAVVALAAMLAVLASGCLTVDSRVDVTDERRATVVIDLLPDHTGWEALGGEGRAEAVADEVGRLAGSTFHVERIDGERAPGVRLTWTDAPIAALSEPLSIGGTTVGPLFQRFVVTHTHATDSWQLDALLAPIGATVSAVAPRFPGTVTDDVKATLTVSMPGRVVSTNADEHDRTSATWTVDPGTGSVAPLDLRTEPGLGISPVVVVVGALVLLICFGVLLVVWSDRARVRRKLTRAAGDAAADRAEGATRPTGPAAMVPQSRRARRRAARAQARAAASLGRVASGEPPKGMYQDVSGDQSVALPVGGAAWGPPPPPPDEAGSPSAADPTSGVASVSAADPLPAVGAGPTPPPYRGAVPVAVAEGASVAVAEGAPVTPAVAEPAPVAPATAEMAPVDVVPPGWYPDPDRPDGRRFWDGTGWTDHRA